MENGSVESCQNIKKNEKTYKYIRSVGNPLSGIRGMSGSCES